MLQVATGEHPYLPLICIDLLDAPGGTGGFALHYDQGRD